MLIQPGNVLVNASHCHGSVCSDVDERTFQAVKEASQNMVPVTVGAGVAFLFPDDEGVALWFLDDDTHVLIYVQARLVF